MNTDVNATTALQAALTAALERQHDLETRLNQSKGLHIAHEALEGLAQSLLSRQAELDAANAQLRELAIVMQRDKQIAERIIAEAPAGIAYLNRELAFEWVNPEYAKLVRIEGERLLGRTIFEALGADTEAQIAPICRQVLAGDPFYGVAFPFEVTADEPRLAYWDFTFQPLKGGDGHVDAILILCTEVSKRVERESFKQAQLETLADENARIERVVADRTQSLHAANEELAAQGEELQSQSEELQVQQANLECNNLDLQEQAKALEGQKRFAENVIQFVPAAVAYLDRELFFRVTNPIYDKILQLPGDRIKDRFVFDVLPGTEAQVEAALRGVLATGEPFYASDFKFTYVVDGRDVITYWDFIYHPLVIDPADGVQGILVLAHDTSKRVELELTRERQSEQLQQGRLREVRIQALEQSDKAKDQFLGILSHELRTPLNAIQGFGSVLEDGLMGALEPEQAKYVGKIMDASEILLGLVNDLLDMSRVQAGKFSVELRDIEMPGIVQGVLAGLAVHAQSKAQVVINELPPDLPIIQADAERMRQIVSNLVVNAIKYTPEGGTITLRAREAAGVLRVEVQDTGIGVLPGQQERIFQAFTQVDMTNTRIAGGVGLGLSIVKALVEAHGGTVGVESVMGQGSTFWFTVPLDPAA